MPWGTRLVNIWGAYWKMNKMSLRMKMWPFQEKWKAVRGSRWEMGLEYRVKEQSSPKWEHRWRVVSDPERPVDNSVPKLSQSGYHKAVKPCFMEAKWRKWVCFILKRRRADTECLHTIEELHFDNTNVQTFCLYVYTVQGRNYYQWISSTREWTALRGTRVLCYLWYSSWSGKLSIKLTG